MTCIWTRLALCGKFFGVGFGQSVVFCVHERVLGRTVHEWN